jgi:hypothetical protein
MNNITEIVCLRRKQAVGRRLTKFLLQVQKKRRIVAKVHCRNIKNECPKPTCDEPVLYPGRCCKVCPGDVNSECYFAVSLAAAYSWSVCALVTLCSWCKVNECGCRDAVFSGHLNALGATSLNVYVGLECALVTLVHLVHCLWVLT